MPKKSTFCAALLLLFAPLPVLADGQMTICNNLDGDIRFSTLDSPGTVTHRGDFAGWWTIKQGECTDQRVPDGMTRRFFFASGDPRFIPIEPDTDLRATGYVTKGDLSHVEICVVPSEELHRFPIDLEYGPNCEGARQRYVSKVSFFSGVNASSRASATLTGRLEDLGVTPLDTSLGRLTDGASFLDQITEEAAALGIPEQEISRAILASQYVPNHDDLIDAFYELPGPDCATLAEGYRLRSTHPTEPRECFRALVKAATCLGANNPACGADSVRHEAWSARFGTLSPEQLFETAKRNAYRGAIISGETLPWTEDDTTLADFQNDPDVLAAMEDMAGVAPLVLLSWPPDLAPFLRCHFLAQTEISGTPETEACKNQELTAARIAAYEAMVERMGGTR